MFLAVLSDENVCEGVKQTKDFIDDGYHVEIDEMDDDLIGRKYKDGRWSDEKVEDDTEEDDEPSLEDKVNLLYYKSKGML
ncbi:hypothetical protein GCM10028778_08000 [Barrientosiimonas marina]|uniref:General stress protein 17M-like domain-containing protein n=1 Tax=Lentibacillus kimchii TaxID=1542911 RepID=A0ABW2UTX2_9BACI